MSHGWIPFGEVEGVLRALIWCAYWAKRSGMIRCSNSSGATLLNFSNVSATLVSASRSRLEIEGVRSVPGRGLSVSRIARERCAVCLPVA
jgi:hypothetical protein